MTIRLVRPAEEFKDKALGFRQEFFDHGERVISESDSSGLTWGIKIKV